MTCIKTTFCDKLLFYIIKNYEMENVFISDQNISNLQK